MKSEYNALASEYKRYYGNASGDLDISNLINNPFINCITDVFSLRISEEPIRFPDADISTTTGDIPDPFLVA